MSSTKEPAADVSSLASYQRAQAFPPCSPERYYIVHYLVDIKGLKGHHQYLYEHGNGLFVVGLAAEHVALQACQAGGRGGEGGEEGGGAASSASSVTISKVEFMRNADTNSGHGNVTGRHKRGALLVKPNDVIAKVHLSNGQIYEIFSGVGGQLLEINSNLMEHPELLLAKPQSFGYIGCIQPQKFNLPDRSRFMNCSDYHRQYVIAKTK